MVDYICEYCKRPVTEGLVGVAEVDGNKVYFHFGNEIESIKGRKEHQLSRTKGACNNLYMLEEGKPVAIDVVDFSQLEQSARQA